jgi:hypothetical protein
MLIFVPATFFGAGLTEIHAKAAVFIRPIASQAHQLCGSITGGCALHIQLNAGGHHLHVGFLQTGGGTMIADRGAPQTGVDTFLIIVVIHKKYFKMNSSRCKYYTYRLSTELKCIFAFTGKFEKIRTISSHPRRARPRSHQAGSWLPTQCCVTGAEKIGQFGV